MLHDVSFVYYHPLSPHYVKEHHEGLMGCGIKFIEFGFGWIDLLSASLSQLFIITALLYEVQ